MLFFVCAMLSGIVGAWLAVKWDVGPLLPLNTELQWDVIVNFLAVCGLSGYVFMFAAGMPGTCESDITPPQYEKPVRRPCLLLLAIGLMVRLLNCRSIWVFLPSFQLVTIAAASAVCIYWVYVASGSAIALLMRVYFDDSRTGSLQWGNVDTTQLLRLLVVSALLAVYMALSIVYFMLTNEVCMQFYLATTLSKVARVVPF